MIEKLLNIDSSAIIGPAQPVPIGDIFIFLSPDMSATKLAVFGRR